MELPINYDILKVVFKGCKNLEFDWVIKFDHNYRVL